MREVQLKSKTHEVIQTSALVSRHDFVSDKPRELVLHSRLEIPDLSHDHNSFRDSVLTQCLNTRSRPDSSGRRKSRSDEVDAEILSPEGFELVSVVDDESEEWSKRRQEIRCGVKH